MLQTYGLYAGAAVERQQTGDDQGRQNLDKATRGAGTCPQMRTRLPLMIAAVILVGLAYVFWPEPVPAENTTSGAGIQSAQAAATLVPYLIKAKVRLIMEQQHRIASARSRGDMEAAEVRIRLAARDIRERLLSDGIHDEAAVREVVRAAAAEAGFNGQQTSAALSAFTSAGTDKPGAKSGLLGGVQEALSEMKAR